MSPFSVTPAIFLLIPISQLTSQGRIVERGTHEELCGMGGLYSSLYFTQFKNEAAMREREKRLNEEKANEKDEDDGRNDDVSVKEKEEEGEEE